MLYEKNKKNMFMLSVVGLFIFGLTFLIATFNIKKTYSAESYYTREKLQNYIVSTALSYFYKTKYTDYEQYSLDNKEIKSFYQAYIGNTPENVSITNAYKIDCSTFALMVYLNALGYDLSENGLHSVHKYAIYDVYDNGLVNYRFNTTEEDYEELYEYYNKGYYIDQILAVANNTVNSNNQYFENMFVYRIGNYGRFNNIISNSSLSSSQGDIVLGIPTDDDYQLKKEIVVNELKSTLQLGDILVYGNATINSNNEFEALGAHAMLYIGNAISGNDSVGLIHSTGNDMRYETDEYGKETGRLEFKGYDTVGVKYNELDSYLDSLYAYDGDSDTKFPRFFLILRPINYFLDSDTDIISQTNLKNKVEYSKFSDNFSEYFNNTISRNELRYLSVEQYLTETDNQKYYPKDDSSELKPINKYSTIGKKEQIKYNVSLTNKSQVGYCNKNIYISKNECENANYTWYNSENEIVIYNNINISVPISDDVKFIECNSADGEYCYFDKGTNTVNFTGIVSNTNNVKKNYSFIVELQNDVDEINFSGATISYGKNNEYNLKFGELSVKVGNFNNNNDIKDKLNSNISSCKSYDTMLGYIECIYNGIVDAKNLKNIDDIKSYFTEVRARKNSTEDIDSNYIDAFIKENYKDNEMTIVGMYGGRKLVGNFLFDRVATFKSYYFEYGDLFITSYNNDVKVYLYTGCNDRYEMRFVTIENGNLIKIGYTDINDDNYLEGYSLFKNFLAKDLFVVLRPSMLYEESLNNNQKDDNSQESNDKNEINDNNQENDNKNEINDKVLNLKNPSTGQIKTLVVIIILFISLICFVIYLKKIKCN